ncbi:MAG: hypothetical protein IJ274_12225, partial [Lachnospiraceae bacterium]|nr:hypothetical protein [Lachnospiraceae bacterium]
MDGTHEQFETDGGGSNVSDSDFPLSESCGRRLSNEEIGFILSSDQFLTHSNEEISAVLLDDTADFDVKKEYLISAYDEYFCSLLYPYDENIEYVGYKKQEAGLYMWEGNFMSRTADTFYSWDEVLKHHMKELGLSIETIPAIQEDGIETIPSLDAEEKSVTYVDQKGKLWLKDDVFLVELRRGSQIEDGKYHIYNYFIEQHSAKEKADFLKDEYGIGGRTFQAGEYTSESHDSKGISFSSYSNDAPAILYTWSQVADAISKDIEAGTYLTKKEIKGLPVYENKMKIRILRNMITDYFRTYYPENRYEQEYKEIPFLSFFSSYDDSMVNMMSTFMGRTLLFESLKNMDAVSEEEQKFKKDLVAALEPLWDLEQHHYSPGWTKLDWRLEREAETALELNLNVKEDDVVYIGEKRYLIYGITDSGYILQDETFPLFTEDFTKEGLLNVLKEDLRNQEYFVEGEKIEVGHGDENRNYRLLKHVVPQLFDSNSDIDYVRYYDQNNREVVFRFHEDEDLFSVSVKDTHNENSFMQVRLAVDENEKTVIPEGFASK